MSARKLAAAKDLTGSFGRSNGRAEVGLFMPQQGEDSSNFAAATLAQMLTSQTTNINLRLFLVKQNSDPRVQERPGLLERNFLHSVLLRDVVFPFQMEKGLSKLPDGILLCPTLLAEKYKGRVIVQDVDDFNAPDFIADHIIGNPSLKLAASVRNLQKFGVPIINAFNEHKGPATLMNSHPGPLPGIRGLDAPFWTRVLPHYDEYTTTLHVVEEKFDSGPILDYHSRAVNGNASKAVMQFIRNAAPDVAEMIYKQAHLRIVREGKHPGLTLQEGDAGYYTLPTQQELDDAKEKGIILIDAQEQMNWLARNYAKSKTSKELYALLTEAYVKFEREMTERSPSANTFFFANAASPANVTPSEVRALDSIAEMPKPVVVIPHMGKGNAPNFGQVKLALEQAGFEVYNPDLSQLVAFSGFGNLEDLMFAFEKPGARGIHENVKALKKTFEVIDHHVVVLPLIKVPDSEREIYQNGILLLQKLKIIQEGKNQNLDPASQMSFSFLPYSTKTDWTSNKSTDEKIAACVKVAQRISAQKQYPVSPALIAVGRTEIVAGASTEISDILKLAHG